MEVYAFDGSFVALVDLDDVLRPEVIQLDFFIMRAGGDTVA